MSKENCQYQPLQESELQKLWSKHKDIIERFVVNNQYDCNNICIDEDIVMSIIAKVDQRRRYFKYFHGLDMSEYKETALICFWYIKLRPIYVLPEVQTRESFAAYEAINEKLAVYYLLTTYRKVLEKKKISTKPLDNLPKKYINELIYSFTYRDISKEAFILLVESMAVFLGLDPYKSN